MMKKMHACNFPVSLEAFSDPIKDALSSYEFFTTADPSTRVEFDVDTASELAYTPDRPYTARSISQVRHLGKTIGNLTVVTFGPHDGTGNTDAFSSAYLTSNHYVVRPGIVPRPKDAVDQEVHMTILAAREEDDINLFAGRLDVLGKNGQRIAKIASVGQTALDFRRTMNDDVEMYTADQDDGNQDVVVLDEVDQDADDQAFPTVTYTTGYWRGMDSLDVERQGDPHAIVNPYNDIIQVCAFLALTHDTPKQHRHVLEKLGATPPGPMPVRW
jgi:hypothetical protein